MVLFYTKPGLRKLGLSSSSLVTGCPVAVVERLKFLGVTLDSTIPFADHINEVMWSCNYHIWPLRYLCRFLTLDVTNNLACSIAGYLIDYCNTILVRGSEHPSGHSANFSKCRMTSHMPFWSRNTQTAWWQPYLIRNTMQPSLVTNWELDQVQGRCPLF